MNRKIALIFFSASNNTAKMAEIILEKVEKLDNDLLIDKIDITSNSDRQNGINIDQYDGVIFGFPIHAWRAPKLIRDWLKTLDGNGKKSSVFFTYGGVTSGVAHYNIKQTLEEQNFQLVSTAEFPCQHTYNCGGWKIMENRPNESDFNIAEEYVRVTYKRLIGEDDNILKLEEPKITDSVLLRIEQSVKKVLKPPTRNGKDCSLCKTCETMCPTNAMDSDVGEADAIKCIRCYRCYLNCPDNVLEIEDLYPFFLKFSNLEKMPNDEDKVKSIYYT